MLSEIKQHENMLDGDDSYYALGLDKIFGISVNFETTPKFELLDNSMHEDLVLYVKAKYVRILEASQLEIYKYGKNFIFDFICA